MYITIIMIKSLVLFLLPFWANAFSRITSATSVPSSAPIIVGSTKPIENFDPLNLAETNERTLLYREAELKHGRLAMVAATLIPTIESYTHKPAIHQFGELSDSFQVGLVSLMFIAEFSSMIRGWKNPFEKNSTSNYFKLLEDYQPGDLGFELITDLNSNKGRELLNKELNNGRLAMIAALGMIVQELVTEHTLF